MQMQFEERNVRVTNTHAYAHGQTHAHMPTHAHSCKHRARIAVAGQGQRTIGTIFLIHSAKLSATDIRASVCIT
jgi:hypothetical protein